MIKFTNIPDMEDVMDYVEKKGEFYMKGNTILPIRLSDDAYCSSVERSKSRHCLDEQAEDML